MKNRTFLQQDGNPVIPGSHACHLDTEKWNAIDRKTARSPGTRAKIAAKSTGPRASISYIHGVREM